MTREEAIAKVNRLYPAEGLSGAFVDNLVALGLLHIETTEDKVRIAAAERLDTMHVEVHPAKGSVGSSYWAKLTRAGAFEIIDILTKSGFRIAKDE